MFISGFVHFDSFVWLYFDLFVVQSISMLLECLRKLQLMTLSYDILKVGSESIGCQLVITIDLSMCWYRGLVYLFIYFFYSHCFQK